MNLEKELAALQAAYPDRDIDDLHKRAAGFCAQIMRKGWIAERSVLVTGEGGYDQMAYNALIEVLLAPTVDDGFKNYMQHLQALYGRSRKDNQHLLADDVGITFFEYDIIPKEREGREDSVSSTESPSQSLWERLTSQRLERRGSRQGRPARAWTEQEHDFLDTYASIGMVRESADLVDMDHGRAKNFLSNLRQQAHRE